MIVKKVIWVLGIYAACMTIPMVADAATINTESCSQAHVQAAVNAAADGDIINVAAGTATWASAISWSNKNIVVIGAGIGKTAITANNGAFDITTSTKAGFRISGFSINSNNAGLINISGINAYGEVPGRFRIDHVSLNISGSGSSPRFIMIEGIVYGLIDNSTLSYTGTSVGVGIEVAMQCAGDNNSTNMAGHVSWNLPLGLGTDTAVYVEDSTISFAKGTWGGLNDSTYGGRMVFRHNSLSGPAFLQTHSTRGNSRGGMKYEYYGNTFNGLGDQSANAPIGASSGTGVIFNNTITGYTRNAILLDNQRCPTGDECEVNGEPLGLCANGSVYDGSIESNGWPCLDQIGRGNGAYKNQPSVPLYSWKNGTTATCATGGDCDNTTTVGVTCNASAAAWIKTTAHSNGDKDYCTGEIMPAACGNHINSYTPYTYPHPLRGEILPPSPGSNTSSSGSGGGCFIATAAFGSPMVPEVALLRSFRDSWLLTNSPGRMLVEFYYWISPTIADFIGHDESLKRITRIVLTLLIYGVKNPVVTICLIFTPLILWVLRRSYRRIRLFQRLRL